MSCFILSYPRSGATWIRYCLEVISLTKTESLHSKNDPFANGFIPERQFMEPFVFKSHTVEAIEEKGYDTSKDVLILLLRNYKECILRNFYKDNGEFYNYTEKQLEKEIVYYIKNIQFYDKWDGERLLIYYEDLMTDFEIVFEDAIEILALPKCRFNDFVSKLDYHKERSVKQYKSGSYTKGIDLLHHSRNLLPRAEKKRWDRKMECVHYRVVSYLEKGSLMGGMFDG